MLLKEQPVSEKIKIANTILNCLSISNALQDSENLADKKFKQT